MKPADLSAILLAGGFSSRMGSPKALLTLGSRTLLEHQTRKLQALGITDILVSGWEDCPPGTRFIPDVYPHCGPLSGIHAGLCRIQKEAALVLPVDMPLLPPDTLRSLSAAHGSAPITLLEHEGQPEPLVGIYEKALAPLCAGLLEGQRHSPRGLFPLAGLKTVPYTADPALLLNCNTPEEYREVCRLFAADEESIVR